MEENLDPINCSESYVSFKAHFQNEVISLDKSVLLKGALHRVKSLTENELKQIKQDAENELTKLHQQQRQENTFSHAIWRFWSKNEITELDEKILRVTAINDAIKQIVAPVLADLEIIKAFGETERPEAKITALKEFSSLLADYLMKHNLDSNPVERNQFIKTNQDLFFQSFVNSLSRQATLGSLNARARAEIAAVAEALKKILLFVPAAHLKSIELDIVES